MEPTSRTSRASSLQAEVPAWQVALRLFLLLSLLTGIVYPLAITGLAQLAFPAQANGSLIEDRGTLVGSRLIGQAFTQAKYFWSRPSATGPHAYNAAASTGSNLGPGNPALHEAVRARLAALRAADPGNDNQVPIDLLTTSASGLDPHISAAAATYQIARVARARQLPEATVAALVTQHTEPVQFGFLGAPRVNVLMLNLALDAASR